MKTVVIRNISIGEGMPKICVPIVGKTKNEILKMAEAVRKAPTDLVEWRADWYEDVSNPEAVGAVLKELRASLNNIPIIFTFRTNTEGGEQAISAADYVCLNKLAAESGCVDLIDVEMFSMSNVAGDIISYANQFGVKVIGSNHNFSKTPEKDEIIGRLKQMQKDGADILKIAVMPQSTSDVLALLCATEEMASEHADRPIVTMSMGDMGVLSRVSGEISGSAITFGAVGKTSAPGQLSIDELKTMLELLHRHQ